MLIDVAAKDKFYDWILRNIEIFAIVYRKCSLTYVKDIDGLKIDLDCTSYQK